MLLYYSRLQYTIHLVQEYFLFLRNLCPRKSWLVLTPRTYDSRPRAAPHPLMKLSAPWKPKAPNFLGFRV